jgi:hypothetical protein
MKKLNKAERRAMSRITHFLGLDEGLTEATKEAKLVQLFVDCRLSCKGLDFNETHLYIKADCLHSKLTEDTENNA